MRSELRDCVAEALELDMMWMSRNDARAIEVHRRISLRRLYIVIFEASGKRQDARSDAKPKFFELRSSARDVASARAAERAVWDDAAPTPDRHKESRQE